MVLDDTPQSDQRRPAIAQQRKGRKPSSRLSTSPPQQSSQMPTAGDVQDSDFWGSFPQTQWQPYSAPAPADLGLNRLAADAHTSNTQSAGQSWPDAAAPSGARQQFAGPPFFSRPVGSSEPATDWSVPQLAGNGPIVRRSTEMQATGAREQHSTPFSDLSASAPQWVPLGSRPQPSPALQGLPLLPIQPVSDLRRAPDEGDEASMSGTGSRSLTTSPSPQLVPVRTPKI